MPRGGEGRGESEGEGEREREVEKDVQGGGGEGGRGEELEERERRRKGLELLFKGGGREEVSRGGGMDSKERRRREVGGWEELGEAGGVVGVGVVLGGQFNGVDGIVGVSALDCFGVVGVVVVGVDVNGAVDALGECDFLEIVGDVCCHVAGVFLLRRILIEVFEGFFFKTLVFWTVLEEEERAQEEEDDIGQD